MFKKLVDWSSGYSHLPWRQKRNLYTTLVSEIMLQQTTVGTVLNHFEKFIKEYPTLKSLAEATEEELTISWKGLGYYRRARNLKKACEFIQKEFKGKIPLDYETLIKIPGIGDYTASALLSIGGEKPVFAIDANIERVLARFFKLNYMKGKALNFAIKDLEKTSRIQKMLTTLGPREVNEALMDLGRNYCKAKAVYCDLCPLAKKCLSLKDKTALQYPLVDSRKQTKPKFFELSLLRVIVKKENEILCYQKEKGEWLEGQYELPTFVITSEDQALKQYAQIEWDLRKLPHYKTTITKYKITNYILEIDFKKWKKEFAKSFARKTSFCDPLDRRSNLSTASVKALKKNREKR